MRDYNVTVFYYNQCKGVRANNPIEAFAIAFPNLADTNTLKSVNTEHESEVKIEGFGERHTINYYVMRADTQRQIIREHNGLDDLINQAKKECMTQNRGQERRKTGREDR